MQVKVIRTPFVKDGHYVEEYHLINDHGFEVHLSNYGCTILSILWPKSDGQGTDDILLGYDRIEQWFEDKSFFGSTAGRCCNRIRGASIQFDGLDYPLGANIPPHQLHGGFNGFNQKIWRATPQWTLDEASVSMLLLSRHLEEGYPGNLSACATISLNDKNEIIIHYTATTDHTTICNLTCHPYFNLDGSSDILEHELYINADTFTIMDEDLVPTGEIQPVLNTPLDFSRIIPIASNLLMDHHLIKFANGFDHNYILNDSSGKQPQAIIKSNKNGRSVAIFTDQPGIQFYSGNHLNIRGKADKMYSAFSGLCLETQGFPNAANIDSFPSVKLDPGETYESNTKFVLA